jgi:hypothetical protein
MDKTTSCVRCPGVNLLAAMNRHHPDKPPIHQILHSPPSQGPINPEALGEDGGGDLLVLGHLGEQLVVGGLVEQHRVVHLLLLLSLAPLLYQSTTYAIHP